VKGFMIAGLVAFFEIYRNLMPSSRVHYEIIGKGIAYEESIENKFTKVFTVHKYFYDWDLDLITSSGLCHFHIDVESCKVINPDYDFELWFGKLIDECREFYKSYLQEEALPIVKIYDSAGIKKHSRHALFKSCTGDMFLNNAHCYSFYRLFFLMLVEKYGMPDVNPFFVWHKEEHLNENKTHLKLCIADQGIYTRNRELRAIGSTKYGQERELQPYCPITKKKTPLEEMRVEQFLNSFVQFTSLPEVGVIRLPDPEWSSKHLSSRVVIGSDGRACFREVGKKASVRQINYRNIVNISTSTPEVIREIGNAIVQHHCPKDFIYSIQPMNFGYSFYYGSGNQGEAPCPFKGKPHKGNHIAYNTILMDQNFERKLLFYVSCLDEECRPNTVKQKPLRTILSDEMMQRVESHLDEIMNHKDVTPEMLQCLF
jgi:hypothetical protein